MPAIVAWPISEKEAEVGLEVELEVEVAQAKHLSDIVYRHKLLSLLLHSLLLL